ncbi:uncharacterized protein LOC124196979 [Daphnia pulex]|uniref:uncharacterized protein LOC124196979 n=1 Tax=Daphnia pulex TaxID=6669 RepID=UPI001EDFE9ED|nr:uncharacterized protein LOC124196979 [Daphnia pulex]
MNRQSISTHLALIAFTAVILFVAYGPVEVEAITSSSFITSTSTITVTSTEKSICGKLINVTAACRRRRNFEFERPEILTFDEGIDEDIDLAFSNFYKQFVPTKTLSMEVTPLVVLPPRISSGRNPTIASHHFGLRTSYPMYPMGSRNKSPNIHPSIYPHQDEAKLQQQQLLNQQRIFFSALSLANVFSRTTVTFTTFKTETKTEVSTSKATFFVVGCTPNPFPFSVCSAKR